MLYICCAVLSCSVMSNSAIPWTVAHQAPLSMGILQAEYWSGLPWLPPGDLPNPGIKPRSPALQADPLPSEPPGKSESEVAQSCLTLCTPMDCSPWNFPGKSTGVGCHFLLHGILLIQGSNPSLPRYRQRLISEPQGYYLSHQGSPLYTYFTTILKICEQINNGLNNCGTSKQWSAENYYYYY